MFSRIKCLIWSYEIDEIDWIIATGISPSKHTTLKQDVESMLFQHCGSGRAIWNSQKQEKKKKKKKNFDLPHHWYEVSCWSVMYKFLK